VGEPGLGDRGATTVHHQPEPRPWSLLHLFTGWVLLVLPLAVMWAKRHNVARHGAR
jgi:uncharacterized membrane protein